LFMLMPLDLVENIYLTVIYVSEMLFE
jgi:hypothetical protein